MTAQSYLYPKLPQLPADLISLGDYERLAKDFMPAAFFEHIASGVADELTLRRNRSAFDALGLKQRPLGDFSRANTLTRLLGQTLPHPILLAPVAYQKLVHADGELASAEAAEALGAGMLVSTLSSQPLEQIADRLSGPKWFQLYWQPTRSASLALVKRAEHAGYQAIVVTVDVPVSGLRNRAQRAGFQLPPEVTAVNLDAISAPPSLACGQSRILHGAMALAPTWADIAWLQQHCALPVLLKGITDADTAIKAKAMGIAGLIVSNHGGRSLDGLPASIEALPAIRAAVGSEYPLLLDSGVRRGSDVFKALALGADAVLIGRPILYGLAIAGALGVAHVLKLLLDELEMTMALAGCPCLDQIAPDCLINVRN